MTLFSSIQSTRDVSQLINWKSLRLLTLLSLNKKNHYKKYRIPKKKPGEFRDIYDPDSLLRKAQYRLLKSVWEKFEVPDYVYAFEVGKSIPEMASLHVGKSVVLSFDIRNYFPSIHTQQVSSLLTGQGMGESAARLIAELCTYKFFVPQGALTSPKISNLVSAATFGPTLKQFCDERNLTLTIYADDITISGDTIPNLQEVLEFVSSTVREHGFNVNARKTKIMTRKTRQWVCGVVVNEKTNLLRQERKRLRAIVHNVGKNGLDMEAAKVGKTPDEFHSFVTGKLNWFRQLNSELGDKVVEQWRNACSTTEVKVVPTPQ